MLCGGVGDLEFVHLLHLDNLLFETVWAHPQSLQHLGSCLHQLQEHVQLAVCACVCVCVCVCACVCVHACVSCVCVCVCVMCV